jgi:dipeptidyl aminopeptidase/acylaminoacyl peptidase
MTAACAATLVFACGQAWSAAPPPASAFGSLPAIEVARISPDGKSIAVLGSDAGQHFVAIEGIDDGKVISLPLGAVDARDIHWAGDGQLMLDTLVLFRPDGKVGYHWQRTLIINRDGKLIGKLLANSSASQLAFALPVIGYVDSDKPEVMVQGLDQSPESMMGSTSINTRLKPRADQLVLALWRVDPATGNGKLIDRSDGTIDRWDVDLQGDARVRWGRDPINHLFTVDARAKGRSGWTPIFTSGRYADEMDYLGYSDPEDAVYYGVRTDQGDKVTRRTLADGKETILGPKTAARAVGVTFDPWRMTPTAIITAEDKVRFEWIDPEIEGVYTSLGKAFKGKDISLVNWSKDRSKFVVEVEAADAAPSWYLFDKTLHSVSPISDAYPALKDVPLGTKTWIVYKAQDGVEIPAYVTYPPGVTAETASKLPLIVMPHGGPAARDEPGFDYWPQFLATRGYVVIQPQFRGSGGFGVKFEHLGDREWGGKMQTDLLDGIAVLAAKGQIDPKRVCIVGWSYGGYAALEGVAAHPDAYKCAVSVNGLSDLQLLASEERQSYGDQGTDDLHNQLGDPSSNRAQLSAYSPAQNVENIQAPVLLIAGEDDTTVPFQQSLHMQKAMEAAGKHVELVTFKGDDHQLHTSADRIAMLEALDKFLAVNLPVK